MRRKDREVADFEEQLAIIKKCDVCRIALNDEDGFPYLVPMNFGMDVQNGQLYLYFHCATEGKKLDLIRKDNRAFFEMDCGHDLIFNRETMSCSMAYESVMGKGTLEFVAEEEKLAALKILMGQYHADDFPIKISRIPTTTVLRLTVTEMTGKRR